jgi:hypothetical protein
MFVLTGLSFYVHTLLERRTVVYMLRHMHISDHSSTAVVL